MISCDRSSQRDSKKAKKVAAKGAPLDSRAYRNNLDLSMVRASRQGMETNNPNILNATGMTANCPSFVSPPAQASRASFEVVNVDSDEGGTPHDAGINQAAPTAPSSPTMRERVSNHAVMKFASTATPESLGVVSSVLEDLSSPVQGITKTILAHPPPGQDSQDVLDLLMKAKKAKGSTE